MSYWQGCGRVRWGIYIHSLINQQIFECLLYARSFEHISKKKRKILVPSWWSFSVMVDTQGKLPISQSPVGAVLNFTSLTACH